MTDTYTANEEGATAPSSRYKVRPPQIGETPFAAGAIVIGSIVALSILSRVFKGAIL